MKPILYNKKAQRMASQIPGFLECVKNVCPDMLPNPEHPLTDVDIVRLFVSMVSKSGFLDLPSDVTEMQEMSWDLQQLLEGEPEKASVDGVVEWLEETTDYFGSPLEGIYLYSFKWIMDDFEWVVEPIAHEALLAYTLVNGLPFEDDYDDEDGPLPSHILAAALSQSPLVFSEDAPYSPCLVVEDEFLAFLAFYYELPGMSESPFLGLFSSYGEYTYYVRWDDVDSVQSEYNLYCEVGRQVPADVLELGPAWLVGNVAKFYVRTEASDD